MGYKIPIMVLFILLCVGSVSAITCNYSETPYIKYTENIEWICELDDWENTTNCLSYVSYDDSVIQVNPSRQAIEQYGIADTFESSSGLVNVFFERTDLRHNRTVQFGVQCQSEVFEVNITPVFKDPTIDPIDRLDWTVEYMPVFVGLFIFVVMVLGFLLWFFKWGRGA